MTRTRQMIHVAVRDVRMTRWLLAGYLLIIAGATAQAMSSPGTLSFFTVLIVQMASGLISAVVIQADSPWRADAFWASQPLDPLAVAAGKMLLVAMAIVLPGIVGQTIALTAFDVPAGDIAVLVGTSTLIYALTLAIAVLIAALTSDLKSWLLVSLLMVVLLNFVVLLVTQSRADTPASVSGAVLSFLAIAAVAILLAWLYRSRRRWTVAAAAGATLFLALVAGLAWTGPPGPRAHPGEIDPELRTTLEILDARIRGDGIDVDLALREPSGRHLYSLAEARIMVDPVDGERFVAPLNRGGRQPLYEPDLPLLTEGSMPNRARSERYRTGIRLTLDDDQRAAIANGIEHLTVHGLIEISESRIAFDLPLRKGAGVRGTRGIRVNEVHEAADRTDFALSLYSIGTRADSPWMPAFAMAPPVVLVDEQRNEAIRAGWAGSSSGTVGIVMPGLWAVYESARFSTHGELGIPEQQTVSRHGWSERARLLIYDWIPIGSYPVTTSATAAELRSAGIGPTR